MEVNHDSFGLFILAVFKKTLSSRLHSGKAPQATETPKQKGLSLPFTSVQREGVTSHEVLWAGGNVTEGSSFREKMAAVSEVPQEMEVVFSVCLFDIVVKHIEYSILILTVCICVCICMFMLACMHMWAMHTCGSQRLSSAVILQAPYTLSFETGLLTFI